MKSINLSIILLLISFYHALAQWADDNCVSLYGNTVTMTCTYGNAYAVSSATIDQTNGGTAYGFFGDLHTWSYARFGLTFDGPNPTGVNHGWVIDNDEVVPLVNGTQNNALRFPATDEFKVTYSGDVITWLHNDQLVTTFNAGPNTFRLVARPSHQGDEITTYFTNTNGDGTQYWNFGTAGIFYQGNVGIGTSTPGESLDVVGTIQTDGHGSSADWNTAFGWGDHAQAGYYLAGSSPSFDALTIGDALLDGNANTAGLLKINNIISAPWSGVSIEHTGTSAWSVMGNQSNFGLYDDENDEWILQYSPNGSLGLYHDGSQKLQTTTNGIQVNGTIITTTGNSDQWTQAFQESLSEISLSGLDFSNGTLQVLAGGGSYWTQVASTVSYDGDASITGILTTNGGNSNQWNQAFLWGDHAAAGYVQSGDAASFSAISIGGAPFAPGYDLSIYGSAIMEEVTLALAGTTPWPDYVFEENYSLMKLEDVANYIHKEHHLPGVPSAKEVEEKGISVGEMNAKLLEKVEEITLYLIEQHKEIESLKEEMEAIENTK